jgi:putative tricarboxylic transport membrane protein
MSPADRVAGLVLLAAGLGVAAWAWTLPGGTVTDPLGPRGFPALLGLGLAACGAAVLAPALGSRRGPAAALRGPGAEGGDGPLAAHRLLGGIALTGLGIAGLEPLGYLVATPLFLVGLLLLQGGVPVRVLLGTAIGLPLALYLLFDRVMSVPLPPGLLERLAGPGVF